MPLSLIKDCTHNVETDLKLCKDPFRWLEKGRLQVYRLQVYHNLIVLYYIIGKCIILECVSPLRKLFD